MFRNRGGFTILEVMIFLAISGAMLAAVMVAVNGQQNRTAFIQAMRDIDSKLQDRLNDVSNGNFSYQNNQKCNVNGGVPHLTPGTGQPDEQLGSRSECLFLGEALQFSNKAGDNDKFYTYTVLGRRQINNPPSPPVPISSFDEANPTLMNVGGQDLSTFYTFQNGITVSKINYNSINNGPTADQYSLVGIYTSFNSATGSGSDNAQSLQTFVYNLPNPSAYDNNGNNSAKKCVDDNNNDPSIPNKCSYEKQGSSNDWSVCFLSNNSTGQSAEITLSTSAAGVKTRLDFNPDPNICPS